MLAIVNTVSASSHAPAANVMNLPIVMAAEPMQLVELAKFIPPSRYNRLKRTFRFGIGAFPLASPMRAL